jgi:hypothetical protein
MFSSRVMRHPSITVTTRWRVRATGEEASSRMGATDVAATADLGVWPRTGGVESCRLMTWGVHRAAIGGGD